MELHRKTQGSETIEQLGEAKQASISRYGWEGV